MSGGFVIDLRRFKAKTEERAQLIVKKIAFELFTLVVTRSPVDTGRFRANNQISINELTPSSIIEFSGGKGVGATVGIPGRERGKLESYRLGDIIFIHNNVEYAMDLELGSSTQAPQGVYRLSVQDLVTHLDSLVAGVKS